MCEDVNSYDEVPQFIVAVDLFSLGVTVGNEISVSLHTGSIYLNSGRTTDVHKYLKQMMFNINTQMGPVPFIN